MNVDILKLFTVWFFGRGKEKFYIFPPITGSNVVRAPSHLKKKKRQKHVRQLSRTLAVQSYLEM